MKIFFIYSILFLIILYGCNSYYNSNLPKCMQCIVKLGESQETVETKLGRPIKIEKNKNNCFVAIYLFTYPVKESDPTNTFNSIPLVYKNVTHIIIIYDNNLKVKNYWFEKKPTI